MSSYSTTGGPHGGLNSEQALRVMVSVGLLPLLLLIVLALMALFEPNFYAERNIFNVLRNTTDLATVAAGQMLVLIVGGFDLSVGAVMALASTVTSTVMADLYAEGEGSEGVAIFVGVLAGAGSGTAIGLVNGMCVAFLRISPFMVTLGTLSIATGLGLLLTQGIPVYGMPESFVDEFGRGSWLGLPISLYVAVAILIAVWAIQRFTTLGRYIYAIGGNLQAAVVSGVPTKSYLVLTYTICGTLAAVAGVVMTARIGSGQTSIGGNIFMLQSIAAAVIAGVSLRGGIGRVELVALGALFLIILTNAMNLMRVDSRLQPIVIGIIVVAAVALEEFSRRRQVRE